MSTATKHKDVFAPALQQFEKDLPRLLKSHYRQWAVYHEKKCLGIFETPEAAYGQAQRLRFPASECLVEYIVEAPDSMDHSQVEGK